MPVATCEFDPFETASAEETERFGARLGMLLKPEDYVALIGPIGAGKTTLVRGVSQGVGSSVRATSPSFVLIHQHDGRPPLLHADLYRLTDPREVEDLGLLEQAQELGAAIVVEWPERCPEAMPEGRLEVLIDFCEAGRRIALRALGARALCIAKELATW